MRKTIFYIAATAIVFASCANQDTFKKDIQNGTNDAINFTSFASKQTRATENSDVDYSWHFYNHHETFQVWSYKNTSNTLVFSGDVVTVGETTGALDGVTGGVYTYTYSPIRYWDKAASTYEFYAAAPSNAGWTFIGVGDATDSDIDEQNECYFKTSSTLVGTNLSTSTNYVYTNSFKAANGDIDKLIAAPKSVPYTDFKREVQLDFIHILSRLNVTIKKDASLEPSDHKNQQEVIMTSLLVKNLKGTGNFSEKAAANPAGDNTRWDQANLSNPIYYTAVENTEVTTDAKYVIQSLVIPQDAPFESVALDGEAHAATPATYYTTYEEYNAAKGTSLADQAAFDQLSESEKIKTPAGTDVQAVSTTSKPYLVLTYTIQQTHDADGVELTTRPSAETFVVYYNLANAFGLNTGNLPFNEGWQNSLNITIKPAAIEFCADVAAWSTVERGVVVD